VNWRQENPLWFQKWMSYYNHPQKKSGLPQRNRVSVKNRGWETKARSKETGFLQSSWVSPENFASFAISFLRPCYWLLN
jgi:hypothetical protein